MPSAMIGLGLGLRIYDVPVQRVIGRSRTATIARLGSLVSKKEVEILDIYLLFLLKSALKISLQMRMCKYTQLMRI